MSRLARFLVVATLACGALVAPPFPPARGDGCGTLPSPVGCGVTAGPDGAFHGVIGIAGQDWVLDMSAHAGTSPGCGDCTWTVDLDCPHATPLNPDSAPGCAGLSGTSGCPPDQTPFLLYLSDSQVSLELVGRVCLGGSSQIVEVGADAEADVERYLRDVTPPDLLITTRPRGSTLTGLPTYFTATPPERGLGPVSFGGTTVRESISLVPDRVSWLWGDGESTGWVAVTSTQAHRYLTPGRLDGLLTTMWRATYTATFDGRTVGPYDATGEIRRRQPFVERVDTSSPVLVASQ